MANYTQYTDIFDPEKLTMLVGERWLNEPNVVRSGIVRRDPLPLSGSLTTEIRNYTFQNSSRQALAAGDTISTKNKQQEAANSPVIFGYDGLEIHDAIEAITEKQIPMENANMADQITIAGITWVDDSVVAMIEGIAAALTANQNDIGASDITLAGLNGTKAKALDKKNSLNGGAIIMHSKVYYDAVDLGLVAATSNTFGNTLQTSMVTSGELPESILGMTPIVTDKLALSGGDYLTYLIGPNTLILRGNESIAVETQRIQKAKATAILISSRYGLGVSGMKWGVAGTEKVTDTQLATSANWTLATNANSNDVAIYRMQST